MRATYDVSSREIWAVVRLFERSGLPTAPLFDRLSFPGVDLRERSRISWDDFVVFSENAVGVTGGVTR